MNTVLLPFAQLFSFLNFFNDWKFALVIHSTQKSILRCFTGVTLCSQSHFSQIISDHILITYAYSLPACLGQMIILTLCNASLSLCLRIYYPEKVHGHCRGIRSYSLSGIVWNLLLNQCFWVLVVKEILKLNINLLYLDFLLYNFAESLFRPECIFTSDLQKSKTPWGSRCC